MDRPDDLRPTPPEVISTFRGEIVSERLVMRLAAMSEAKAMFALFNDWEVVRWLARPNWPQEQWIIDESLKRVAEEQQLGQALYLSIHAGTMLVGGIAWTHGSEEGSHIGYWIGRRFWGKGYMTEAAATLCDWIFAASRVNAIHSGVFDGNLASLRVQDKIGFIQTGTSVQHCMPRGQDMLHIDTKLTRTARRVVLEKVKR